MSATPAARSRKSEQKERSRAAILASAASLLRARGIEATSVMDVMRGAGLTVGGFYGHFDSKEALLTETIRECARKKWDELEASARGQGGALRVLDVVRKYASRAHRDHPELGCLLPSTAPDAIREAGEPYRRVLGEQVSHFTKSIAGMLATEEAGRGKPSSDARTTALGLVALMYGALSLSRALAGTSLSDDVLAAARALAARVLGESGA